MDTAIPNTGARSFFLELPAEIRVMIYEKLAPPGLHASPQNREHGGLAVVPRQENYFALASVNRQIREECTPILYRDFMIVLSPGTWPNDPSLWWIAEVDPATLSEIQRFNILFGNRYQALITVTDLEKPVFVVTKSKNKDTRRKAKQHQSVVLESVLKLEVVGGKRRIMTKQVLEEIVLLLKEQAEPIRGCR